LTINPNETPTATIEDISPSPAKGGQSIHFDGGSSDSDGSIVAWKWTSDVDGDFGDSEDLDYTDLSVGTHTISFSVKDDSNEWSDAATEPLTIDPNERPTATIEDISPSSVERGQSVHFNGSSADSDGNVVAWKWTSDMDGDFGDSENLDHAGLSVGTHTISFSVKDNNGAWSDSDTETLTISEPPNTPPTINLTAPSTGTITTSITPTLQWTADDVDDGNALTFDVYLDNSQNPVTLVDNNSAQKSFTTMSLIGGMTYYWKVVADDGTDQTTSEIWSFYVNNKPQASITANATSIKEGDKVSFDASKSTDEDGDVTEYSYSFDDGSNTGWIPTSTIEHVYTSEGEYTITVKVRDNNGAESTNSAKWSIQVTPPPPPDDTDDDSDDIGGFAPIVVIGVVALLVIILLIGVSFIMSFKIKRS